MSPFALELPRYSLHSKVGVVSTPLHSALNFTLKRSICLQTSLGKRQLLIYGDDKEVL